METAIDISFVDTLGNDLLNESTENNYDISGFKLFHLIDSVSMEVNEPTLDSPKGFFKSRELRNGKYFLRLFPNQSNLRNNNIFETVSYLQLSSVDTDTIICQFAKTSNSLICIKVVYNGFNVSQWNSERFITIEK
jgi:hypothetical protein